MKSNQECQSILSELDSHLRTGDALSARKIFLAIPLPEIPSELAVGFAQIARRLNLPEKILKLLGPSVRPVFSSKTPNSFSKNGEVSGTDAERALYAVGLTRLGAFSEARELLATVDADLFPDAHLFRAHVEIFNWNYQDATSHLWKYRNKISNSYQILVCDLNLSAAYLNCGLEGDFIQRISQSLETAKQGQHTMILGNLFELLGQYFIFQGELGKANQVLEEARSHLKNSPSQYLLFARKWNLLGNFLLSPESSMPSHSTDEFFKFRRECIAKKEWETLRECDFFWSLSRKDSKILKQIYQGTPYIGYQRKMLRLAEKFGVEALPDPSESLITLPSIRNESPWLLGQEKVDSAPILGSWPAPHLKKMFLALVRDYYKPQMAGELFSEIYPGEYFSPTHSFERLHKISARLRGWFEQELPYLAIESNHKKYALLSESSWSIPTKLWNDRMISNSEMEHREILQKLQHQFLQKRFSAQEISQTQQLSETQTERWIQWAKQGGYIEGGKGTGWKKFRICGPLHLTIDRSHSPKRGAHAA